MPMSNHDVSGKSRSSDPLQVSPLPALDLGKSERTRAAVLNPAFDFVWSARFAT